MGQNWNIFHLWKDLRIIVLWDMKVNNRREKHRRKPGVFFINAKNPLELVVWLAYLRCCHGFMIAMERDAEQSGPWPGRNLHFIRLSSYVNTFRELCMHWLPSLLLSTSFLQLFSFSTLCNNFIRCFCFINLRVRFGR